MRSGGYTTRVRASVPDIGPSIPTAVLPLLFSVVAAGLCLLVLPSASLVAVGLLLAVLGTVAPKQVPAWLLVLMLGLSQLWRDPLATDVVYYLLLAGMHLLHVLSSLARLLPWNGRMQVRTLARPLRRYLFVQGIVQPVAAGALIAFGRGSGGITGLSLVSAALLCVVAVALRVGKRPSESV
jgi:hypothetical protein